MYFLLLLLCLLFPSLATATTYYVDPTGNDTTGDGSIGNPWKNPGRCFKSGTPLTAGDTCSVNDGTYTDTAYGTTGHVILIATSAGQNPPNGTSASPITLKSTNPYGAVLKIPGSRAGATNNAIYLARSYYIIEGFDIDGSTTTYQTALGTANMGVNIAAGTGIIIRHNKFHHIARTQCSNSAQGNAGIYSEFGVAWSGSISYNLFYSIGRLRNGESGCSTTEYSGDHGLYLQDSNGLTIDHNVCYDTNRGYCFQFYHGTHQTLKVVFNTLADYNNSAVNTGFPNGQIILTNTMTNVTIANNIFSNVLYSGINTTGSLVATNIAITNNLTDLNDTILYAPYTGVTESGSLTNTSPGFTNSGARDYTLASGSAAINAGTSVTGFNYNGSAPDIGAYETFGFSSCSIANATPTVINATFENNVNPPLLPSTGVTTFTARKATVADTVTGVVRTGDNQLDITVQNAFVAGNAADISWASGNLTDSADIGGTYQKYVTVLSNQACTNNVGGSPSHLFIQARFEFHGLRGTEAAPVVIPYSAAAENTNINVVVGGKARLRLALTCTTADCPPTGFYLYYSKDGGAYAVVPDTFGADNIAFCGTASDPDIPNSGSVTTDQLSTSGTFVAGALVRTSNAIPTIDLAQNNKTEPEYCVAWDTDSTADATYDFRIYKQDGTAIDTYTVTPRATVRAMSAGLGF